MHHNFTRRSSLRALGLATLAATLPLTSVPGQELSGSEPMAEWLRKLHANASALSGRQISSLQWQEAMDQIYAGTPLEALRSRLAFNALRTQIIERIPADRGELFHRVMLPGSVQSGSVQSGAVGAEPPRMLITKVAYIRKGRSIPPHGHSNMASAFLCISGEFAVKQYDKLEDGEGHLILRQTMDESRAGVGSWSSISDYRNNVHWLTAKTDDCFLFTSKLIAVESGRDLNGRINVDVKRADYLGSETMRAPKISAREAAELY